MKKLLLGTTALVAAGAAFGAVDKAEAADGVSLSVSGFHKIAFATTSQDTGTGEGAVGASTNAVGHDGAINFGGSTTLDNGMTVGVVLNTDQNATANTDERFAYFKGGFGQIRLGATESARQSFLVMAPGAASNFGVSSAFFKFHGNATTSPAFNGLDDGLGAEDAARIIYFSPKFNGFDFALSWAPDDTEAGQYGLATDASANGMQDHFSAGVAFSPALDGFGLTIKGGYESYSLENCDEGAGGTVGENNCENNPTTVNAGASISFGAFTVGGGYRVTEQIVNDGDLSGNETTGLDLGISFAAGQGWTVALQYADENDDQADAAGAADTSIDLEEIQLNTAYVLGPGIDVQAAVAIGSVAADGTANDNDFVSVMLGTSVSF